MTNREWMEVSIGLCFLTTLLLVGLLPDWTEAATSHLGNEFEQIEAVSSEAPSLAIQIEPAVAHPGEEVVLSVISGMDPDGDPLFYFWHAEDGAFVDHNADFTVVRWQAPESLRRAQDDRSKTSSSRQAREEEPETRIQITGFAGDTRGKIASVTHEILVQPLDDPTQCPDYVTRDLTINGSATFQVFQVGQGNVRVECQVYNQTDEGTDRTTTAVFYLNHHGIQEEMDFTYVLPLGAHEGSWEVINLDLHEGLTAGDYCVRVEADGREVLVEADETNNAVEMSFRLDSRPVDLDHDGYVASHAGGDDCDDTDGDVFPGAFDRCEDGVDQDCDGWDAICEPNTIYVPGDFVYIRDAVAAANNFDTVMVAPGIYYEDFIQFHGKTVTLQSAQGPQVTVIDGSRNYDELVVFNAGETRNAVIDGFTLRNGNEDLIHCYNASPTIINNILLDGNAYGIQSRDGSAPLIVSNVFARNRWCAIWCWQADGMIINNTFVHNVDEGIIVDTGSHVWVYNNIVAENGGYGIEVYANAWPFVENNNVWNNGSDMDGDGIGDWNYLGCNGIIPYLSEDPRLVNPTVNNFHLRFDSPCRNSGDNYEWSLSGINLDFDREERMQEGIVDLGADEFSGVTCFDLDQDGYLDEVCGGDDCDDGEVSVHPGGTEVCGDLVDQDCSGSDLECPPADFDGDGFDETDDCDDFAALVYPGASETCGDSVDQDCDGEDLSCADVDNDGDEYTENQGDCDDSDPVRHPGAADLCENGVDENCDGVDPICPDYDQDDDGFEEGVDCDDSNVAVFPGASELCDGIDNNCDRMVPVDEIDSDGDGFWICNGDCDDTNPQFHPGAPEICDGLDNNCSGEMPGFENDYDSDGVMRCEGDCDDYDPAVFPGAPELCDGIDNDCDEVVPADEIDADGDGWWICNGDCDDTNPRFHPGAPEVCDGLDNNCSGEMPGFENDYDFDGVMRCEGDCDDYDPAVFPGAPELCDGIDNNCDEVVPADEIDADGDGFRVCMRDCNDENPEINPGTVEICDDGIDNDCDDLLDQCDPDCWPECWIGTVVNASAGETVMTEFIETVIEPILEGWLIDKDGDGFAFSDCDDKDPLSYPSAVEICSDGIDQNCDGEDEVCVCADLEEVACETAWDNAQDFGGLNVIQASSMNLGNISLKIMVPLTAMILWGLFCRFLRLRLVAAVRARLSQRSEETENS